jgi:hypothetical protein
MSMLTVGRLALAMHFKPRSKTVLREDFHFTKGRIMKAILKFGILDVPGFESLSGVTRRHSSGL